MAWMMRRTMEGERARVTASTDPLMSIAGLSTGPDMVRLREQGNRIWGRGGSWEGREGGWRELKQYKKG